MKRPTTTSTGDLSRVRVLVLGDANVGKTLLCRRLCHEIFCADSSDSDVMSRYWGATVGIRVDVLKRDTDVGPSPAAVDLGDHTEGFGANTFFSRLRQRPGTLASPDRPQQASYGSNVQTVELYELGGTRQFSEGTRLPLRLIPFDGVLLVYNRASATSTANLAGWLEDVKRIFGPTDMFSTGMDSATAAEMAAARTPRVMLLGVEIAEGPQAHTADGEVEYNDEVPDELMSGEALLSRPRRSSSSTSSWNRNSKFSFHEDGLMGALVRISLWVHTFVWLLLRPNATLSVQYAESLKGMLGVESTSSFSPSGLCVPLLRAVARVVMAIEQFLLFVIAVVLFGPSQSVVPFSSPSASRVLQRIEEDPLCVAHGRRCRLTSRLAMEATMDDLIAFFDQLQHWKTESVPQ